MDERLVGWMNCGVKSTAGRVCVVFVQKVGLIEKSIVWVVGVLMEHLAELDGLAETLSNEDEPLLYGEGGLIDNGLSDGFEWRACPRLISRGLEGWIDLGPRARRSFKFHQLLRLKLDIALSIAAGVGELVAAIAGGD